MTTSTLERTEANATSETARKDAAVDIGALIAHGIHVTLTTSSTHPSWITRDIPVSSEDGETGDHEWDQLFGTPSPQLQALKALLAEGREEYKLGGTQEIAGDTFA